MKRVIAALLFILYFVSSSGATIHLHFCMNEFAGLSLDSKQNETQCSYCGMDKTNSNAHSKKRVNDCCKDREVSLKIKCDYKATGLYIDCSKKLSDAVAVPISQACQSYTYKKINPPVNNSGPPEAQRLLLFIYNSVFRI